MALCGKNMKLVASEAQFSEVSGARILVFINHLNFWQRCLFTEDCVLQKLILREIMGRIDTFHIKPNRNKSDEKLKH